MYSEHEKVIKKMDGYCVGNKIELYNYDYVIVGFYPGRRVALTRIKDGIYGSPKRLTVKIDDMRRLNEQSLNGKYRKTY